LIAVNWNQPEDYVSTFWEQNIAQFWTDTEFPVSDDLADWAALTEPERDVYKHVLAGLTGLDTLQGSEGMPLIAAHTEDRRKAAVLTFMGAMEQIHAKSYSTIFTTLISSAETSRLLDEWVPANPRLTFKADAISQYYRSLLKPDPTPRERYMAKVASVFLETYSFYSGFYYPLWHAGHGRMTASGEIIDMIVRDESIHGLYVGLLAQEDFAVLSPEEQAAVLTESDELLAELHANEVVYTREIYGALGPDFVADVIRYVEYNADKALMNLGREPQFNPAPFSPIVQNAIRTDTKNHDFFSKKGNGYVKSTNVVPIRDEDFAALNEKVSAMCAK
jgi:ribonucleoside-diphosphate reductase beta chain